MFGYSELTYSKATKMSQGKYFSFLIGDAHDIVNVKLAAAGNGEVVGDMCNRSRYVLPLISAES